MILKNDISTIKAELGGKKGQKQYIIIKGDNMKNDEGLSDFMKFAYKCNKVKDVEEAFEEYPVEEWEIE